jgi:hypothetical protein
MLTDDDKQWFRDILDGRLDALEQRLKDHTAEAVRDMETKILTEFHKWGSTSDMRTRQAIADIGMFSERLLNVEDRLTALERQRGKTQ